MKRFLFIALVLTSCLTVFGRKNVKTIHVTPDNATIYLNGNEVGTGSYTVKFDRHTEFVMFKLVAPGYKTRTVKLLRDNPKETIEYKLQQDEALLQSVGSSDGVDIANKWMSVVCKKGLTEDKVWRRLMSVAVDNFENVEVRDKAAGWIKTAWKDTKFESGQLVRTRLEIRISVNGDDDELTYKIKLSSEINEDYNDCYDDQCFEKYPRVLKKFYDVINDLQSSLGSNN
ncbi:MAG: hypothetical protein IJ756_09405 [Paludibacteraceae bacterium]|nr:hypothetical protein [Paludibacteraceae bacterium]